MKISSIVLLLAIIGASLQQTAPAPSCSRTDTANNNRFALKWLEDKKVTIHATPQTFTDTTVCGGEWAAQKTCCDLNSVKDFIRNQNENVVNRWKNYIGRLSRVRGKFLAGIKKLVPRMSAADIGNRWKMIEKNSVLASRFQAMRLLLPKTQTDINTLKSWAEQFEENIKIFKDQGKNCFETMKKTRAAMLCAVCSGRATTFSQAQSTDSMTFSMTSKGCKDIVNSCYPIWKFNFGLTSIIQYINTIKNAKKSTNDSQTKFRNDVTLNDEDTSALRETFAACTWASQNMTCSNGTTITIDDHAKRLCRIALVINKENTVTEGDENTIDDLGDSDVDEADQEAAKPVSPPINPPQVMRLMQSAPASDPKVGVAIDDQNGYQGATSESGLTPSTTVESNKAGETQTSFGFVQRISALIVALITISYLQ